MSQFTQADLDNQTFLHYAFVVDGEGMIQYAEVLESAGDQPNFDAIKATLAELG